MSADYRPQRETHPLTWRLQHGAPVLDIAAYEALDGYAAVRKALGSMQPGDVTQLMKDSGLRGRGGAGFPTGIKWSLVPMGPDAGVKYLLCNADEMEPGTFKDRMLLEQLPHLLIESMIVAAYAIQASRGYCLLYTSDAADERSSVDLGGRRIIKKKILGLNAYNSVE